MLQLYTYLVLIRKYERSLHVIAGRILATEKYQKECISMNWFKLLICIPSNTRSVPDICDVHIGICDVHKIFVNIIHNIAVTLG